MNYESKKQSEIRSLEERTYKEIAAVEEMASKLRSRIIGAVKGSEQPATGVAMQIEGWENIQNAMLSLIKVAKREFFCVSRPPDWYDLSMLGIVSPRAVSDWHAAIDEREVDVRWLIPREAVPCYVGWRTALNLPRRLVSAGRIKEKFLVVDGERVLMNLRDPLTGKYGSAAILIENPGVAEIFREQFLQLWEAGKPPQDISSRFEKMEHSITQQISRAGFSEIEIRVYLSLLRIGACSSRQVYRDLRWNDPKETPKLEEVELALSKLMQKGLVLKHEILEWFIAKDPRGKPWLAKP